MQFLASPEYIIDPREDNHVHPGGSGYCTSEKRLNICRWVKFGDII
jgi:hypothetical protein